MISKIKEQLNIIDLIIDSVEESGGFTNLDKKATLDAVRNIYDIVLTAPAVSPVATETKPDIEVSVYGVPDLENVEIELEKYESNHLNDDCAFEIEKTLHEDDLEEELGDEFEDDANEEDITVEEIYLNDEGEISEEKMVINFDEDAEPENESLETEEVFEEDVQSEDDFEEDMQVESLEEDDEQDEEPSEEVVYENEIEKEESVKFVIGEIMDDGESCDDTESDTDEVFSSPSEDAIVFANDDELMCEDADLVFTEDEKNLIINELFEGNASNFGDFVVIISQFTDFDEAILYLQDSFNNEHSLGIVAEKLAAKLM
ncbi:MAG: hypothetical protein R3Y51_00165 [Rikenellaceae bacterium]